MMATRLQTSATSFRQEHDRDCASGGNTLARQTPIVALCRAAIRALRANYVVHVQTIHRSDRFFATRDILARSRRASCPPSSHHKNAHQLAGRRWNRGLAHARGASLLERNGYSRETRIPQTECRTHHRRRLRCRTSRRHAHRCRLMTRGVFDGRARFVLRDLLLELLQILDLSYELKRPVSFLLMAVCRRLRRSRDWSSSTPCTFLNLPASLSSRSILSTTFTRFGLVHVTFATEQLTLNCERRRRCWVEHPQRRQHRLHVDITRGMRGSHQPTDSRHCRSAHCDRLQRLPTNPPVPDMRPTSPYRRSVHL